MLQAASGFITSATPRAQLPVAFSKQQQCKLQQINCTNVYCILRIFEGKWKFKQKSASPDETMQLQPEFYMMWQYCNVVSEAAH